MLLALHRQTVSTHVIAIASAAITSSIVVWPM
jgi:hypothetical protein